MKEYGTDIYAQCKIKEDLASDDSVKSLGECVDQERSEEPDRDQQDRDRNMLDAEKDGVDDRILKRILENREKCESVQEDLHYDKEHRPYRILEPVKAVADQVVAEVDAI